MNIVFLETANLGNDISFEPFKNLGQLTTYAMSDPQKDPDRVKDADVIVINKVPMNEHLLSNAKHVKLIALTATGANNVDFAYCNSRGIAVANISGYSTASVVQHTFALLFYLYEKLSYYDDFVKNGAYSAFDRFSHFDRHFNELAGKTWGIVGLGAIGRGVANIAKAFGCHVIYYSTSGTHTTPDFARVSKEELLASSDIISIHAPLNEHTLHLFSYDEFSQMKNEAYLINVGRGNIVDEKALLLALQKHQIEAAALDVLSVEPILPDNPLMEFKDRTRLLITPHIAWATTEARQRCIEETYRNIEAFINHIPRNLIKEN